VLHPGEIRGIGVINREGDSKNNGCIKMNEENFMKVTKRFAQIAGIAAGVVVAVSAAAQGFPNKIIRVVNPAAPGGNSDVFFRLLQPKMTEALGQQLVFDYRPGAGGIIGGEIIARSAPDGYTTGLVAASFVINPSMNKKMPYDSAKDFTALGLIVDVPSGLVVHPQLPVKNVKELIALAKTRPGQLFCSSSGRGTVGHMSVELLNWMAGTKITHVPYKGAGPAVIDLVAGHVQLQFSSLPLLVGHVQTGRLRLIAQTGEKRSSSAKDIPTMPESGLPGYVVSSGFSFIGPAGIPRAIAERLNGALVTSLRDPHNRKTLIEQGADPVGSSIDEHDAFIKSEIAKWIKVARGAGIEPQ
jgi:tripartite-type tricarboxylate transporter receptor subunit TctC